MKAFFYNADGHDQEVDLDEEHIRKLDERTLLWVDVKGRERAELEHLAKLFGLDPGSIREILNPQDALYLDNYGEYFQFDIIGLARDREEGVDRALVKRRPEPLEFLVGPRWIITVREADLPFSRRSATRIKVRP